MKKNKAESLVRRHLKAKGFNLSSQKDERASGVDIAAFKDDILLLIEVKEAKLHNRSWQVDAVSKKQREVSDTIAIVTPYGIIIQPMKEHLSLCGVKGMRYLTEAVQLLKVTCGK